MPFYSVWPITLLTDVCVHTSFSSRQNERNAFTCQIDINFCEEVSHFVPRQIEQINLFACCATSIVVTNAFSCDLTVCILKCLLGIFDVWRMANAPSHLFSDASQNTFYICKMGICIDFLHLSDEFINIFYLFCMMDVMASKQFATVFLSPISMPFVYLLRPCRIAGATSQ